MRRHGNPTAVLSHCCCLACSWAAVRRWCRCWAPCSAVGWTSPAWPPGPSQVLLPQPRTAGLRTPSSTMRLPGWMTGSDRSVRRNCRARNLTRWLAVSYGRPACRAAIARYRCACALARPARRFRIQSTQSIATGAGLVTWLSAGPDRADLYAVCRAWPVARFESVAINSKCDESLYSGQYAR